MFSNPTGAQTVQSSLVFVLDGSGSMWGRVDGKIKIVEAKQVMDNLVSNAIKYTPDNGEVNVRIARSGPDQVQIVVRDSGIGIPEAEQGQLFREFFRASASSK